MALQSPNGLSAPFFPAFVEHRYAICTECKKKLSYYQMRVVLCLIILSDSSPWWYLDSIRLLDGPPECL